MRKRGENQRGRKGKMGLDMLAWIIIGAALIVLFMISLFYQKRTGISLMDKIKGIIFGRG